jgi:hypothetical protein
MIKYKRKIWAGSYHGGKYRKKYFGINESKGNHSNGISKITGSKAKYRFTMDKWSQRTELPNDR